MLAGINSDGPHSRRSKCSNLAGTLIVYEDDKEIALETCKSWLMEQDAAYLAKENIVVYWQHFNPETRRGDWVKLKLNETCRIIKSTRAGLGAMRFIKPELVMLAAQETERAYKQGCTSRGTVPPEYFNFERAGHFNDFEMLTLCMLQELVGRGWNVEAVCLGKLMSAIFVTKGYVVPSRTLRWRLIRAVAEEAGIVVRDRLNRLTVTGVGRFVAVQIDGIEDSIKESFTNEEFKSLIDNTIRRFKNY